MKAYTISLSTSNQVENQESLCEDILNLIPQHVQKYYEVEIIYDRFMDKKVFGLFGVYRNRDDKNFALGLITKYDGDIQKTSLGTYLKTFCQRYKKI